MAKQSSLLTPFQIQSCGRNVQNITSGQPPNLGLRISLFRVSGSRSGCGHRRPMLEQVVRVDSFSLGSFGIAKTRVMSREGKECKSQARRSTSAVRFAVCHFSRADCASARRGKRSRLRAKKRSPLETKTTKQLRNQSISTRITASRHRSRRKVCAL